MKIQIIIRNYDKYKGRKDVTINSWFRLSNRFLEDPDFFEFDFEEKMVWVYCLSLASQKDNADILININHAVKICGFNQKKFLSGLEKLNNINCLDYHVTDTLRQRNADVTETCVTEHNKHNKQDITEHNTATSALPMIAEKVDINLGSRFKVQIKKELIDSWANTYDQDFLKLSLNEMRNWLLANEHKAPKSDWARFMNTWFKRGWEQYRKTMKSNPTTSSVDDLMNFMGWKNE